MSVRILRFDVDENGITPCGTVSAGMQNDDNVTTVSFVLSNSLYDRIAATTPESGSAVYRFEAYTADGLISRGEASELVSNTVNYTVPRLLTSDGGKVWIYLIISMLNSDSVEAAELYSFPACLSFECMPNDDAVDREERDSLSALVVSAKMYAEQAEDARDEAVTAAAALDELSEFVRVPSAQKSGKEIFIFDTEENAPMEISGANGTKVVITGKNLLPGRYYDGIQRNDNGIVWSANSDGSITFNGTAIGTTSYRLLAGENLLKIIKTGVKYRMVFKPDEKYDGLKMRLLYDDNTVTDCNAALGELEISVTKTPRALSFLCNAGFVADNITVHPMITLAKADKSYSAPVSWTTLTVGSSGTLNAEATNRLVSVIADDTVSVKYDRNLASALDYLDSVN